MKITGLSMQIDGRKVILGFADRNAATSLVKVKFGGQPEVGKPFIHPQKLFKRHCPRGRRSPVPT